MDLIKKDIATEEDVKLLVDSFYERVNKDNMLSPIFNDFAKINWEHHMPQMYAFWGSLLLGTANYKGRPFPKHMPLPIDTTHFERWLTLFITTVDTLFEGPVAEDAKWRAFNIAGTFQYKLGLIR